MRMSTVLMVAWLVFIMIAIMDGIKKDRAQLQITKQNTDNAIATMEATFELLDAQCIRDMRRKNPNSQACEYADIIEIKMSGRQK